MVKIKRYFACGLTCVFLLLCFFSYNINVNALIKSNTRAEENLSHCVFLEASFDVDGGTLMESDDGVNFSKIVNLKAGSYQFRIIDNGCEYGHPGTINDTTATISTSGWKLSNSINAMCTLVASGGEYIFTYNTESHKLQIIKSGFDIPDDTGDGLKLNLGDKSCTVFNGDKILYSIYLKADKIFEDIRAVVSYNEDKLILSNVTSATSELTDMEAEALKNCPNISDAVYNSAYPGVVAVNASNVDGYDFREEKLFLNLEFTVIGTGETTVEFTVQEMSVLGGEESYFICSKQCAEGVSLREVIFVSGQYRPSEPAEPVTTDAIEPTETTVPITTEATEPIETTVPLTTNETDPTEPVSSAETEASDSSANTTSAQLTTETTMPVIKYELGDVNRDSKLSIRDATFIQKYLAKMIEFDEEQIALADFSADGKVNIKDATLIQKRIANL